MKNLIKSIQTVGNTYQDTVPRIEIEQFLQKKKYSLCRVFPSLNL